MRDAGLVSRSIPGEALLFRLFNTIGETLPSMALGPPGRDLGQGQVACRGAAGRSSGRRTRSLAMVQPLAAPLFDEHRAAGRPVVMATTTPVRPGQAARRPARPRRRGRHPVRRQRRRHLRRDARRPVRVERRQAGRGRAVGRASTASTWPRATPTATACTTRRCWPPSGTRSSSTPTRAWCDGRGASLADDRSVAAATSQRCAMAKIPVVNLEIQRLALSFTHPLFFPYAKFDIDGVEQHPDTGPAIIVGNHRSYFDPAAMARDHRPHRPHRALPRQEGGVRRTGGRPDRRGDGRHPGRPGHRQRRTVAGRRRGARRGDMVAIMPQGTIPRGKAFFDPKLKGRWGAARLAAHDRGAGDPGRAVGHREGVAAVGSPARTCSTSSTRRTVTIRVGAPVALKYQSADADTKRIMKAIMDLLPPESRVKREPTDGRARARRCRPATRATCSTSTSADRAPTERVSRDAASGGRGTNGAGARPRTRRSPPCRLTSDFSSSVTPRHPAQQERHHDRADEAPAPTLVSAATRAMPHHTQASPK